MTHQSVHGTRQGFAPRAELKVGTTQTGNIARVFMYNSFTNNGSTAWPVGDVYPNPINRLELEVNDAVASRWQTKWPCHRCGAYQFRFPASVISVNMTFISEFGEWLHQPHSYRYVLARAQGSVDRARWAEPCRVLCVAERLKYQRRASICTVLFRLT